MITFTITDYRELLIFWLFFTRFLTIMMQLPIFEEGKIPPVVRVLSTMIFSYALYPSVRDVIGSEIDYIGVEHFWYLTISHAMIGLFIGFLIKIIMSVFVSAGSLMNQQMGFTSVTYFDPSSVSRVGPFEMFIQWTMVIMLLQTGALLPIFKGILASFSTINLHQMSRLFQSPIFYINFLKDLFTISLVLSGPILFTNLLLHLVLGIIARVVPQLNILMVSFAVNIGLGLFVFYTISDEFFHSAYKIYLQKIGDWFQFIGT